MKTSAGLLAGIMLLALGNTSMAQKRSRSTEAARQWLDSLTAEETANHTTAVSADDRNRDVGTGSAMRSQPGDLQPVAPVRSRTKWSNLKKQALSVVSNLAQVAQAQGYWPATSHTWQSKSPQNAYTGAGFATFVPATSPGAFQRIQSGVVSLDVPSDWQPMSPMGDNVSFTSPQGESFGFGKVDVFCDQASMRNAAQISQAMGIANPAIVAYMQRLVAPPLTPEQIVARLLPQISGGAVYDVHIHSSRPLPYAGAAIVYDYVLLPQKDALWRAGLSPVLQRASQVPMRGEMRITVMSGMPVGIARSWTFIYAGASAPTPVYVRNAAIYSRMFQSMQFDSNAVQRSMAGQQQIVNSVTSGMKSRQQQIQDFTRRYTQNSEQQITQFQDFNRKTGTLWIDAAGQQTRMVDPTDPNYTGFVPWGSQPYNSRPVNCPMVSSDPSFVDNTKPTPNGCTDLQPYH